jgi:hypothetical protein
LEAGDGLISLENSLDNAMKPRSIVEKIEYDCMFRVAQALTLPCRLLELVYFKQRSSVRQLLMRLCPCLADMAKVMARAV